MLLPGRLSEIVREIDVLCKISGVRCVVSVSLSIFFFAFLRELLFNKRYFCSLMGCKMVA